MDYSEYDEAKPKPRPVPDCALEEMLRLEHGLILKGATLYGDPNPAPGYDAAYRWEDDRGNAVAALAVYGGRVKTPGKTVELRVPGHVYTRRVRSEDEMGQTINYFVNASARFGGSKSLGEFPLHLRVA